MTTNHQTWYLLLGGFSSDGMGQGEYIGRTTDKTKAKAHYDACRKNPYSIGGVRIVTDSTLRGATQETNWDSL